MGTAHTDYSNRMVLPCKANTALQSMASLLSIVWIMDGHIQTTEIVRTINTLEPATTFYKNEQPKNA